MRASAIFAVMIVALPTLHASPLVLESGDAPVTLVELFTSEGCSSCPPADAWVSKLKSDPDLWRRFVPVVFHVDYWNGLGWPDRFASSAFTSRQRRYAAAWRSDSIYTPGFALNGSEWRDWSRYAAPPAPTARKSGRLVLTLDDKQAHIEFFAAEGAKAPPLRVELALLGTALESDVKRGENGGRKLRHDFTVLHLAGGALTSTDGKFVADLPISSPTMNSPTAVAAWVTPGEGQPPIQAVGGWLQRR